MTENTLQTRGGTVDVLIQTHNEELNLPRTLASIAGWVNRIFVVDSGSTDRTAEIARSFGASFVEHPWEGYSGQKNWALDNLPWESEWVLILDADEAVSPELKQEIVNVVTRPVEQVRHVGFYINRVLIFMGREIRHCGYFPSWNLRLFRHKFARYEKRDVHEHMITSGSTGYLKKLLIHEDRRGMEHFFAKHNRYSTLEAREIYNARDSWPGVREFFRDRNARRRFIKSRVVPQLPMPWLWRLMYMYILQLGFLDGQAGWVLCNFISSYEFFIHAKYLELRRLKGRDRQVFDGLSLPEGTVQVQNEQDAAKSAALATALAIEPREVISNSTPIMRDEPVQTAGGAALPTPSRNGSKPRWSPMQFISGKPRRGLLDRRLDYGGGALLGGKWVNQQDLSMSAIVRRNVSPWTLGENVRRMLWAVVYRAVFRKTFHTWYGARASLLRAFGAKIGRNVRIRRTVRFEIPWNLEIADDVSIGDEAILYALGPIRIGARSLISQYVHLCAGTHDHTRRDYPLLRPPIEIGADCWIAADAFVGPGVTIGDRTLLGARSSAFSNLPEGVIAVGNPARPIKPRELRTD